MSHPLVQLLVVFVVTLVVVWVIYRTTNDP